MRKFALLVGLTALSGCGTAPVRPGDAEQVQPLAHAVEGAETVPVTVTRDGGYIGMGCQMEVQIEGAPVGRLWSRQTMTVHLPPGETIVAVRPISPCGLMDAGRGLREAEVNLRVGRPIYFRTGFSGNGLVTFTRTGLR